MIEMASRAQHSLDDLLSRQYPFRVIPSRDGVDYVIEFPDLPGCMTQVESLDDVGQVADEIRTLWIETAFEDGDAIPPPSYPEEYSGKVLVRMPRSLHRRLVESANREGVSLNQTIITILSSGEAAALMSRRLDMLEDRLNSIDAGLHDRASVATPTSSSWVGRL